MTDKIKDTAQRELFPEITPYSTGFLDVDETHSLYWEQSGNPDGVPIVFVHGGPGSGTSPKQRRFFDPDHYRIVLFDQRGSGKSHPLACLENNTLNHLVGDMEALRTHLNIERWHVFGGSWGSALSLAYAQAHPERCTALILRGIFLCEQNEIDWFMNDMGTFFPGAAERFQNFIPEDERNNLLEAYYKRLTGTDEALKQKAAKIWCDYEDACVKLIPAPRTENIQEAPEHNLAGARLECHYFRNEFIRPAHSLLNGIDKIRHIPGTIIQGRYDVVCPIKTAYKLHKAWPEADYIIVPDAGHASTDTSLQSRLIEATENAKTIR